MKNVSLVNGLPAFGSVWEWTGGNTYMGLGIGTARGPRYLKAVLLNLSSGEFFEMIWARQENDGTYPMVSGWKLLDTGIVG